MTKSRAPLIAVVDDDEALLESIADLLASAGFSTLVFASARELLDSKDLPLVHCLVSDVRMPDLNGWQLASMLRKVRPGLPIVLITAHEAEESGILAYPQLAPTVRILRKPFAANVLLSAITDATNGGAGDGSPASAKS